MKKDLHNKVNSLILQHLEVNKPSHDHFSSTSFCTKHLDDQTIGSIELDDLAQEQFYYRSCAATWLVVCVA